MKKLKISTSALEIRNADFPVSNDFNAVKLTCSQAMSFGDEFHSFSELVAKYGENNVLHVGEFYEGYVAVYYWPGRIDVVNVLGQIRKIAPEIANTVCDYRLAENIRAGKAWECVYPTPDGSFCVGAFRYVWTFKACTFARDIVWVQRAVNDVRVRNTYSPEAVACYARINAEEMDAELKEKLVAALLTDKKIAFLSDAEAMVLKHYLGEGYYNAFFCEVE